MNLGVEHWTSVIFAQINFWSCSVRMKPFYHSAYYPDYVAGYNNKEISRYKNKVKSVQNIAKVDLKKNHYLKY